ncbi:MOSC domain-containing protein [Qipengyuania huizhouensis]|uniref:MOSC domain-containing protein n=1 Tax=Qipengyuania huizhouensis TaxID=2867245 RepID=UPI001C86CB81|nr:MOSC domain-containing protein [Qipengyuania huizhouensis]
MSEGAIVHALCVGQPAPLADGKISSIDKHIVDGPVRIDRMGLEGDTQSDRKHHGGEHMAVHVYAADHYPSWRREIPDVDRLALPGAFGENLYAEGLTESQVYIGDRYRLGTALLELSMGRQPCSTLERHFRRKEMVRRIIANRRCGWYFRVIEEGEATAGDRIELVERFQTRWSVDKAFGLLFDPKRDFTPSEVRDLLSIRRLGPQWQAKLEAKLR